MTTSETPPPVPGADAGVRFPGIPTTADGTAAVVWVETLVSQAACAYPITSSTQMGVGFQAEVANGKRNAWGEELAFLELESEHSSATACEGFALAGGRVTNFTSGQGLILMKEVLYTIAGKRLPCVFHIAARALTSQSLNVHAGHDDVMAVTDTGWGMLFAKNVQEAADLALIARRAAEEAETPFLLVQDGFLTSHTIENVLLPEPDLIREYVGPPATRLRDLMDPARPLQSGVVQNQDSYMKGKIAQRYFTDRVPAILERAMDDYARLTGRRYGPVQPYRLTGAAYALVGMGSLIETAEAVVDYLRDQEGIAAGALAVTTFRPFPGPEIVAALGGCRAVAILERMDNPLAQSNPLTTEIKAAFADALTTAPGYPGLERIPVIYSGAGGLGSRDIRPGDLIAIVDNMRKEREGKRFFVVGIDHPLTVATDRDPDVRPPGAFSMRGHSVGGFGSVTTNKVIATIVGDLFGLHVQAFPKYGSEKKGLPTNYYFTAARAKIRTHAELAHVDFVPLNDANAFNLGNPLAGILEGGMIFVHTDAETPEALWAAIPAYAKKIIRRKKVRVLGLDTIKIARASATSADLVQRMQGIVLLGVFLRATPYGRDRGLSEEELFRGVETSLRKYFGKRGERVIQDNLTAVRRGYHEVFEVPRDLIDASEIPEGEEERVMETVNAFFV